MQFEHTKIYAFAISGYSMEVYKYWGEKSTLRQTIIIFNMYKHIDLHSNTSNVKIQYQSHTHRSKGKELVI